ncbi:MAG: hypothetical protein KDA92_08935, partial [Planctomycetales bacterium]|nr:hypothetical protein [Planctomycetales bacterium]
LLKGYIQDLTDEGAGVFAAYADVTYPADAASVTGAITYGVDFPNGQSGDITVAGLVDEVGGFDGLDRIGPNEAMLFSIPMRADRAGTFTFGLDPADILPQHNVLLFDRDDPVPTDRVEYRGVTLNFTQVVVAATNPRNSLDVNDDANISAIDALLVINQLNGAAEGEGGPSMYLDVSADGYITALDALLVINELNRMSRGEGEAPAQSVSVAKSAAQPLTSTPAAAASSYFAEVGAATSGDNDASDSDELDEILGLL